VAVLAFIERLTALGERGRDNFDGRCAAEFDNALHIAAHDAL
jgi:hypothetical protein